MTQAPKTTVGPNFCQCHPDHPAPVQPDCGYKSMFEDAINTLAKIDEILGIGGDGECGPDETVDAIDALKQRITELEAQTQHWKANHDNQVAKSGLLTQRPDLPVDRLPAYRELERLQAENERLRNNLEALEVDKAKLIIHIQQGEAQLATATPSSRWKQEGKPDPHDDRYDRERAALCMGNLTDDELANAAFLNYDRRPHPQDIIDGKAFSPIVYLTAVKDRIRWLSRKLDATTAAQLAVLKGALEAALEVARTTGDMETLNGIAALDEAALLQSITEARPA